VDVEVALVAFSQLYPKELIALGQLFNLNVVLLFIRLIEFVIISVAPQQKVVLICGVFPVGTLSPVVGETDHQSDVLWILQGNFEPMHIAVDQSIEALGGVGHLQSNSQVIEVLDELAVLNEE